MFIDRKGIIRPKQVDGTKKQFLSSVKDFWVNYYEKKKYKSPFIHPAAGLWNRQ